MPKGRHTDFLTPAWVESDGVGEVKNVSISPGQKHRAYCKRSSKACKCTIYRDMGSFKETNEIMKHPGLVIIPGMKGEREGAGKSCSYGSWQPTQQELPPMALVGKYSRGPNCSLAGRGVC